MVSSLHSEGNKVKVALPRVVYPLIGLQYRAKIRYDSRMGGFLFWHARIHTIDVYKFFLETWAGEEQLIFGDPREQNLDINSSTLKHGSRGVNGT